MNTACCVCCVKVLGGAWLELGAWLAWKVLLGLVHCQSLELEAGGEGDADQAEAGESGEGVK